MKAELNEFLDRVWKDGGKVFLAYKTTPSDFDVPPPSHWPEDRDKILNFILAVSARGKDVYFSPAIYKDEASSKHKENVSHSHVLWVDIDSDAEAAYAALAESDLPEPTCRVLTGSEGHEHWYWGLENPLPRDDFEILNRRIAQFLKGYGADHCWDANRVLRPPFTQNCKDQKNLSAVDIHSMSDHVYDVDDFSFLPEVKDEKTEIMDMALDMSNLPTMQQVFASYNWDPQHLNLFNEPPPRVRGTHVRNRSLMRMAYFCAEVGMTEAATYVVLEDFDRRLGKFVGRSDRNRRLAELIAKGRAKFPFGSSKVVETKEDIQQVFTLNELLHADFTLDWLVENLLADRTINSIMGYPNTGKSRLAMQLALSLASGSDFLDWNIPDTYKVMYLSLEMDRYMLKHFVEGLSAGADFESNVSSNFLLVPLGEPLPIESPESSKFIDMLIDSYKPKIVFIDALGSLTYESLNDEKQSKAIMNMLMKLTDSHEVVFILVHHLRKPQNGRAKEMPELNDMYGSQYVSAYMSTVLTLWNPDVQQTEIKLIESKTRGRKRSKPRVLDGDGGFKFRLLEDGVEDDDGENGRAFGAYGDL